MKDKVFQKLLMGVTPSRKPLLNRIERQTIECSAFFAFSNVTDALPHTWPWDCIENVMAPMVFRRPMRTKIPIDTAHWINSPSGLDYTVDTVTQL